MAIILHRFLRRMLRTENSSAKNVMFVAADWNSQGNDKGFALLIAVIFMSVMLTFGLSLGALGYKQQVLASSAIGSQYAFYAADAALECVLYADQQQNLFDYASHDGSTPPSLATCDGTIATQLSYSYSAAYLIDKQQFSLDSNTRCAEVTVYKPPPGSNTTYIFSQGYDVSCAMVGATTDARFVSRGLDARY